jgi:branched-chain amino acid transport system substrate-binding protein
MKNIASCFINGQNDALKPVKCSIIIYTFCIIMFGTIFAHASESVEIGPVKIAAIFAKTGMASQHNKYSIEGVKLTIDEINKQGGVLGRQIDLIVIDNQSTPIGSKIAAEKAVEHGVCAVIGAAWTSHSLPIANVLQKAQIPMLSPISTNPKITKIGNYIFRTCFDDNFQGKSLAEIAYYHIKAQSAIILTNIDEEYSVTLSNLFRQFFNKYGGNILWEGKYRGNDVDFSDILTEVKKYRPDVIFLPGYAKDSGLLIKQANQTGIHSTFLGADSYDSESIYRYAGDTLEGSYSATHWHPDISISSSMYERLKKIYGQKKMNSLSYEEKKTDSSSKINSQVVLGHDAAILIVDAIKRAGSTDREKIRQALEDTKHFKGITGVINFDENGDPINKRVVVLKFEKGKWVFIDSFPSEEIKIASIFAHSGNAAIDNRPSVEGVRFAVNEINKAGGVLGLDIKLIEIDNKSTPIGSYLAAQKAVQNNVVAIIGAAWSSHSFEIAKVAEKYKIPMISNISTLPDITKIGEYIFRACFTDAFQGQVLAEFAIKDLKADSAAIITDLTSRYGVSLAFEFERNFRQLGGKTFSDLYYKPDQEDFTELAIGVKKLNPDIVFIPGYKESALIIETLLSKNVKAIPIGGDGWSTEKFFEKGGNNIPEGYYCTHWVEDMADQNDRKIIRRYKRQYGAMLDPSFLAYDAVFLLKNAIEKANSVDYRDRIKEALAKTKDFKGLTGKISLNADGDPIKQAIIMQLINGKLSCLKTINP